MPPDMLVDPVARDTVQEAISGYRTANWGSTHTSGTEWDALKAVIRGNCMSLTYRLGRTLQKDLNDEERELALHQGRRVTSPDIIT